MIRFTIFGQPYSKANSRQIVPIRGTGKQRSIKSGKALAYEADALRQIPFSARVRLEGKVRVTLRIYYRNEVPDLDESIVLDVLQDRYHGKGKDRVLVQRGVIVNDRQVREKHVIHGIDKRNPRAEIEIEPLHPQQQQQGRAAA